MVEMMQVIIYVLAILAAGLSMFYSIKSRRVTEQKQREIFRARMNMAMGIMLICFSTVQLFLHEFDSWARIAVGFVFGLIGCFNLFVGIRNHAYFSRVAK